LYTSVRKPVRRFPSRHAKSVETLLLFILKLGTRH